MYKFKKSLIGLFGLLILGALATVTLPHVGRGANGTSNAPASQTQNVNVVNTTAQPVPVLGTVGINGTPTVAVANFPATTSVAIDGSANTVKIDTTNPLPVRDVDNPARQPFKAFNSIGLPIGQTFGFLPMTTVPAGKVLVIDDVSVLGLLSGGDKLLYVALDTGGAEYYLHLNDQGTDQLGRGVFVASDHVHLYLTAGSVAQFYVERNPATTQSGINFAIFGHYVDAP